MTEKDKIKSMTKNLTRIIEIDYTGVLRINNVYAIVNKAEKL